MMATPRYLEDRRPVQDGGEVATVTDATLPDLAAPNYATTDVDATPGSPRPFTAAEPNYATTDVDATPGSPRPFTAAEPNYATTDVDPTPGSPRPFTAAEPNYATTDIDPAPGPMPYQDEPLPAPSRSAVEKNTAGHNLVLDQVNESVTGHAGPS